MIPQPPVEIYQLRIYLKEISPMIWRRLLVPDCTNIADLHAIIQIVRDHSKVGGHGRED